MLNRKILILWCRSIFFDSSKLLSFVWIKKAINAKVLRKTHEVKGLTPCVEESTNYFLTDGVAGTIVVLFPPDGFPVVLGFPAPKYITLVFAIVKGFLFLPNR